LTFFLQHKPDPSMQYKIIIEGAANIGKPEKPSVGHRAEYSLFIDFILHDYYVRK